MKINKLISILRNPYGIESDVVKATRLEAANMIEAANLTIPATDQLSTPINPTDFKKAHAYTPTSFPTFAPKNHISENKPIMAELPLDLLSELLCPAYKEGCLKYERNSWRRGFKISVMFSACLRHLTKFYFSNEDYDKETLTTYGIKKHHLGAAIFCIISMYNDVKHHPYNDDRRKS